MTGPHSETESPGTRPISVAELLARNGTIGAPAVTKRRRRRRGDSDAVTVAELTGEIPVIRDDDEDPRLIERDAADVTDQSGADPVADEVAEHPADSEGAEEKAPAAYWSQPEPRWPKSPPQPKKAPGPERSAYPRPLRQADPGDPDRAGQSGAEGMNPDPLDHYSDVPVDVMDSEVREAEPAREDSAYVRSYLHDPVLDDETDENDRGAGRLTAGSLADEDLDEEDLDTEGERADAAADGHPLPGRLEALWRGGLVVFQSILAVAFGAGLFVAFDELWRWNSIVALVLSVLVILGLVVGVRVVRKTEDIASTLIAVAVGALITLGPLALSLQSG